MSKSGNRFWKWFGIAFLLAFIIFNMVLVFTNNMYVYRATWYNFANIDDYKIFDNKTIAQAPEPQPWPLSEKYNQKSLTPRLSQTLEETKSVAFLIIKDDSILTEKYWEGYGPGSYSNSFSMAKSWVSAVIGSLVRDSLFASLEDPVGDYVPEFNKGKKRNIRIIDLLRMSSGLDWVESYSNPLSVTVQAYYGNDLYEVIRELEVERPPGQYWKYKSGDTQILAFFIEQLTNKTLVKNVEERLWKPMGAEYPALWSVDREGGNEKAYCCLNSNARDFARLGKLYMNKGRWNGEQLVDSNFVKQSLKPVNLISAEDGDTVDYYGYQWWLIPEYNDKEVFYARGILGQYVIAVPEDDLLIVRLGHETLEKKDNHYREVFVYLEEVEKMLNEESVDSIPAL